MSYVLERNVLGESYRMSTWLGWEKPRAIVGHTSGAWGRHLQRGLGPKSSDWIDGDDYLLNFDYLLGSFSILFDIILLLNPFPSFLLLFYSVYIHFTINTLDLKFLCNLSESEISQRWYINEPCLHHFLHSVILLLYKRGHLDILTV
jgi:hypothetical protein